MKKLLLVVAACAIASPAFAQVASRGSVANSARLTQSAGAMAFGLIAQGEYARIEAPEGQPYVNVAPGAFFMPYINDSFNASRGGELRIYDPVGSFTADGPIGNSGQYFENYYYDSTPTP
jgi:hypothetical protein